MAAPKKKAGKKTAKADLWAELSGELQDLADEVARWRDRAAQLETELAELQAQGYTEASPHYREGRYLYLVHPQREGARVREYIGADKGAQRAALARVERWGRVQELRAELHELGEARERCRQYLSYTRDRGRRNW